MAAEIGNTHIVNGYGFARKEMMSFIARVRKGLEFASIENVFCQKNLEASYSREEMEVLRFENPYQQRQIWREIYTL
ncbi:hypothetical protein MKW98_021255, partial [Papaver atlanticum]